MRNRTALALSGAACWCALALSCSSLQKPLAGDVIDTPNEIIGTAVDTAGNPLASVHVQLLPVLYDPVADAPLPDSLADTTDAAGRYCITTTLSGSFNLVAADAAGQRKALVAGLTIARADTVFAPVATLRRTGSIRVTLEDPADTANAYAYLPGTLLFARILSRSAAIGSVPAGIIPAVYYKKYAGQDPLRVIKTNVSVSPAGTTVIADLHSWRSSKKLVLNTTATGADVSGTVIGFPVLVRLTTGNFDFSQANAGGSDLRFAKTDGTPLPYEIEQWDAAGARAEVWVKADTIYGNNSTQSMVMYWGAAAGSASSAAEVFDTAAGFQGVWHLNGAGGATVLDATANRYNGTTAGMTAFSSVPGMIGNGQRFDGKTSGITMTGTADGKLDFYGNGTYSLSAWVYADTLDSLFHPILAKGNYQYALQCRDYNDWEFFTYKDTVWHRCVTPATAGAWFFLTGVRNNDKQYLYVNGRQMVDSAGTLIDWPRVPDDRTKNVTIGFIPEMGRYWKGIIDEARISSRALSADWIRLSYMNQKVVDALVNFK